MNENEIGAIIIETAIAAHRQLGPGLPESVYEAVLAASPAAPPATPNNSLPFASPRDFRER